MGCPPDSFVVNNTCLGCPGGYYDATKKLCLSCKDGFTFNSTALECQSICSGDTIYNPTKKYCECPADRPNLSLANRCVSCALPKYWDSNVKECRECSTGLHYNASIGQCYVCPSGFSFDIRSYSCIVAVVVANTTCVGNKLYDQNTKTCVCPATLPYDTGSNCVACSTPNFWDQVSKQCLSCAAGSFYNSSSHACISCPPNSSLNPVTYKCETTKVV